MSGSQNGMYNIMSAQPLHGHEYTACIVCFSMHERNRNTPLQNQTYIYTGCVILKYRIVGYFEARYFHDLVPRNHCLL